ncbi:MAG: deoxynucleoside kinase [Pseudomonadota bacterium]
MNFDKYKYIVVEGPIGVGKTTLSRKIAEASGAETLLEMPEENRFLERFYRDSARYALPAQLSFLFQRVNQLRSFTHGDGAVISDFLLDKDPMFAQLTLAEDELALYRQVYETLNPQARVPDLVIYLQAQPETLIERVRKRGVPIEAGISESYLRQLCESYSRFFYHYDTAPVLTVNAEHLNPIDSGDDFELLLAHIRNMRGKREFFSRGE